MSIAAAVMIVSAALIAIAVSHAIARFAVKRSLLPDRPNGRSSHRKATPRSGGLAIFGGFFLAMALYVAWLVLQKIPNDYAVLVGCAAAASAFGAVDDMRPIGARLKLAAQIVIAIAFVALLGPVERLPSPFGAGEIALGAAAFPLTVFWIVAFMNAFNFMDGINGLAGASAIFVLSALAVAAGGASGGEWAAPAIFLACAAFGYLPLNSQGRLFMGDAGSQFLGFSIAALAVLAATGSGATVTPLFAPIAFMPFLFDVAFTLGHRIRRRRNILEAHKEHLYQLLVRQGRSHQAVTALYLTLTALTTTVAIMANALGPSVQYLAALGLAAAFAPPAILIYRRADAAGLFSAGAATAEAPLPAAERPLSAAAE